MEKRRKKVCWLKNYFNVTLKFLIEIILILLRKNIEDVKYVISDSKKFVKLNITPDKYLNYIINAEKKFKQLFKDLLDNDKISKDEYDKICPKGSRPGILSGNPKIRKLLITCQNFDQFYLL